MNNFFAIRHKALGWMLIFAFLAWISPTDLSLSAQDTNSARPDSARTDRCQGASPADASDSEAEALEWATQFVEKAEKDRPAIKKKPFPWLGVFLAVALAGGLIYYFLILKTTLRIDSDPSGAKVYLDGKDTAKITPCELKPAIGAHKIRLSLNGYADVEREVVVKNGKNSLLIPLDLGGYTLLTPANNANVLREAPCLISWDSNALAETTASQPSPRPMAVPKVDLELYQGDVKVADIARGVPNSGSYTWNVPGPTAEGHDFKIQISCPGVDESRSFGPAFNLQGFREDFADNTADFWIPDSTTAWNAAGGYYSANKTGEGVGISIYDFFYPESSFTVESRLRWSEFQGANTAAPLFIMLGTSNSFTNNSGYALGYTADGTVSVQRLDGYNFNEPPAAPPETLFSAQSSAVNKGINSWNTIKVVRSDSSYSLYINDILVHAFQHSAYNPNYILLGFGGAGVTTRCDFDLVHMTVGPGS